MNSFRYELWNLESGFLIKSQAPVKGKKMTQINTVTSYMDCEMSCDDEQKDTCHSFSYCGSTKQCIITQFSSVDLNDPKISSSVVSPNSDCMIFTS